ncbi:MAG: hypothetical protein IT435_10785 [Phycisphaerales bacterium]|nr:hypothetical protein [Phycisphaerales bacterium]
MFWKVFTIVIAVLLGGSIGPSRQPHDLERNDPSTLPSIPHPDLTKATHCPVICIADGDTVTVLNGGKSEKYPSGDVSDRRGWRSRVLDFPTAGSW